MPTYQVLLYYMFVRIDAPSEVADRQRALCTSLGLRGRILIAPEGLNGTVSGTREACHAYMEATHADPLFSTMTFKIDAEQDHVFRDLSVKVKKELVTFRVDDSIDPISQTGEHLSPAQFRAMMDDPDVIILDGRTDYEYDIGHFRGALRPNIDAFRLFPDWIRANLADAKNRPILTYCTGGIRCEKLTAFMLAEGFQHVYQLDGGIVTYGRDPNVKGAMWDGLCYVFDERVTVPINHTDDRLIVGRCSHCGAAAERFVNCANLDCHEQHITCDACEVAFKRSCSELCMHAPRREDVPHL